MTGFWIHLIPGQSQVDRDHKFSIEENILE